MTTRQPTVRTVVVSWNGAHLLGPCLDSLLAQELPGASLQLVVVDNASTDGTVEFLTREYPQVEVRVTDQNLGFAGGVAVGLADLANAGVDYAFLLNNDATVEPDAVRQLVEHLADPAHAGVGAATATILLTEPDDQGRILVNSTGNVLLPSGAATDRDWLVVSGTQRPPVEVFGFCGGAALLRTATLTEVGGFDQSLFLYYEDTDLSWRMRAAGWTVQHVAAAVAHHQHAASSDAASPLFRFYNTRNSLLVFGRHAPAAVVLLAFLRQSAAWLRYTLTRAESPALRAARRRALLAVLRALPTTLATRRRVWQGAAVDRKAVYRAGLRVR